MFDALCLHGNNANLAKRLPLYDPSRACKLILLSSIFADYPIISHNV